MNKHYSVVLGATALAAAALLVAVVGWALWFTRWE